MPNDFADTVGRCFDANARALVLYARQWLDDGDARDAVQEAFVRLLRRGEKPPNMLAWLFRVVRSTAFDNVRSKRRRQRRERVVASERAMWFEPRPEDAMDAAAVEAALAALPDEQREVIVLRLWSELTLAEVAEICQAPVSTVFSRYRAGLAAIREHHAGTSAIRENVHPRLSPKL